MDGSACPIRHPFAEPPEAGKATEVAEGVLWLRLPLPMRLDHVNVWALDDGDGWTLIDTGFDTGKSREIWKMALSGPLADRPVRRLVVTHHHPDHLGLAGWFQARGVELLATRTAWLYGRMLTLDVQQTVVPEQVAFWRAAGMEPERLARRMAERPWNFADVVAPMPLGFTRLRDGERLRMGGRDWEILTGDGHAPEHATFWSCDDDLLIAGDQILPGISPNIGVYPTEPQADPLGEWLDSCRRFARRAEERHLVLPGHKLPFTGLPARLSQMIDNHESALDRLRDHLRSPQTACGCMQVLFGREVEEAVHGLALVETLAHLNRLRAAGLATAEPGPEGAVLWHAVEA
ncbi:MAG: MBL fold metallo-hydrolase [Gemmobacter sp.]